MNKENILGISKNEEKKNYVNVELMEGNEMFEVIRRSYKNKDGNNSTVIKGFEITFNDDFEILNVEQIYEVKGKLKKNTFISSKHSKNKKKLENKQVTEKKHTEVKEKDEVVKHEKFETIKTCIESNVPIYLVGPAGSGKNFTLEQIANELGYNFYFSNSVQQEYKLTGFIDAGGKYHETEFYKACKEAEEGKDCIFFLDEMDASIPEVLVLLNAAIANGYFEFPNGKIKFGNKVHFVAAGNTFGNGADEEYTGRMVLDQATLDRFAVIEFDYSVNIQLSLAKGDTELVEFIIQLREKAKETGIRATFSYRCISMVKQLEGKLPMKEILKMAVLKGLDNDTVNTLKLNIDNKYDKQL